jgi:ATP dependent DNA ligase domain
MPTIFIGLMALALVLWLLKSFARTDPKHLIGVGRTAGGIVALAGAAFLGVRGQLSVAVPLGVTGYRRAKCADRKGGLASSNGRFHDGHRRHRNPVVHWRVSRGGQSGVAEAVAPKALATPGLFFASRAGLSTEPRRLVGPGVAAHRRSGRPLIARRDVPVDEPLGIFSQIVVRVERPLQHLPRDVLGYVPGPPLYGVEGDHAERVRILAAQEIADDRFAIGLGGVGFDIGDAELAMVVEDQIHGDIIGRLGQAAGHGTHSRKNWILTPAHWNRSAALCRLHWPVASGYSTRMVPPRVRTDGFVDPCIPSRAPKPPSGPDWVHEIKHDGYRLIVRSQGETVRLFTRRGYDWTDRYPAIARAAAKLRAKSFTIDGEAAVCGPDGIAIFDALHCRGASGADGRFGGTQRNGVIMNNEDFQALARQGAIDALKALAAIAVDPNAVASDREHARSMVELRLDQASNDIPPDLRREIENVLHKRR